MNVKILGYTERDGGLVAYHTDYAARPDFVYPKDKFRSSQSVIDEIKKSIRLEEKRKKWKDDKWKKVKGELDA